MKLCQFFGIKFTWPLVILGFGSLNYNSAKFHWSTTYCAKLQIEWSRFKHCVVFLPWTHCCLTISLLWGIKELVDKSAHELTIHVAEISITSGAGGHFVLSTDITCLHLLPCYSLKLCQPGRQLATKNLAVLPEWPYQRGSLNKKTTDWGFVWTRIKWP